MIRNPKWGRDESILALDLYIKEGILSKNHPKVIELSVILHKLRVGPSADRLQSYRNTNGIAMKLANFASLDPRYSGVGLIRVSRQETGVWQEFHKDPTGLAREAESIRARIRSISE